MRLIRSLALACLLVSSGSVAAGTALAQSARDLEAPAPSEARARLDAATLLFEERNYEGAIAEFEASYALDPEPLTRLNIGQCHRQLERYEEAIVEYRRFLAEATEIPRDRRAQIELTIHDLEGLVGTIAVDVSLSGAAIRIDGREVGVAPLAAPLRLGAGRRVLEVVADGYVTARQDLLVAGGEVRTVVVELQPANTGTLHVAALPEGTEIRIDGVGVGPAPIERTLASGGHVLEATHEGFRAYRESLSLAVHQDLRLSLHLEADTGPGLVGEWWFWTILGAGAVGLVVGAVFVGIELTPPTVTPPACGDVPMCASATFP